MAPGDIRVVLGVKAKLGTCAVQPAESFKNLCCALGTRWREGWLWVEFDCTVPAWWLWLWLWFVK